MSSSKGPRTKLGYDTFFSILMILILIWFFLFFIFVLLLFLFGCECEWWRDLVCGAGYNHRTFRFVVWQSVVKRWDPFESTVRNVSEGERTEERDWDNIMWGRRRWAEPSSFCASFLVSGWNDGNVLVWWHGSCTKRVKYSCQRIRKDWHVWMWWECRAGGWWNWRQTSTGWSPKEENWNKKPMPQSEKNVAVTY